MLETDSDGITAMAPIGRRNTLVGLTPGTRTLNTLRASLAAQDHPILGDRDHAPDRLSRDHPHPALYGSTLGFQHPAESREMRFDLPLPDDLERLRRKLAR